MRACHQDPVRTTIEAWDRDVVIIDIMKNHPGKELVIGSKVYGVDFTAGSLVTLADLLRIDATVPADGLTSVADMNKDGNLDISLYQ